jgi:hypothetical protein
MQKTRSRESRAACPENTRTWRTPLAPVRQRRPRLGWEGIGEINLPSTLAVTLLPSRQKLGRPHTSSQLQANHAVPRRIHSRLFSHQHHDGAPQVPLPLDDPQPRRPHKALHVLVPGAALAERLDCRVGHVLFGLGWEWSGDSVERAVVCQPFSCSRKVHLAPRPHTPSATHTQPHLVGAQNRVVASAVLQQQQPPPSPQHPRHLPH